MKGQVATLGLIRERIVAYAAARAGRQSAEDLAQEVLLVLIEKYPHVDSIEDLVPLSIQILKFKTMTWRQRLHRSGYDGIRIEDVSVADDRIGPVDDLLQRERAEHVIAAISRLGDRCRELFRLKLEGRDYDEIRVIMAAKTMAAVYTWDFRCRQRIMKHLLEARWNKP